MSPTIEQRNREKHTTEQDPNNNQNNLHEQDQELQSRILNLNTHIKRLNQSAGRVVPDLNKDLYKVQKSAPNTDKGHQHQLIKTSLVYTRTVYPTHQLSQVWLRKLERRGGSSGKIGKNMIFWRKIVIFHTKYPKNFRASLRNWKKYYFLA